VLTLDSERFGCKRLNGGFACLKTIEYDCEVCEIGGYVLDKPRPECKECLEIWRRTGKPPECYRTKSCPKGISPVPTREQLDAWHSMTFKR
jgi:hypothetical protein